MPIGGIYIFSWPSFYRILLSVIQEIILMNPSMTNIGALIYMIAIHSAAGPELVEACYKVPEVRPDVRCPTGEARITL